MYYESTRNNKLKKKFSEVLLEGLAGDGGLYVPKKWPKVSKKEFLKFKNMNYQQIVFNISKSKVNSKIYTSWVDGDVIFRNETFDQIIQKLQRLYNITIINNSKISNQLFNASINVEEEKIEEVLGYFNKIYNIDFQIFNNKIIIN